MRAIMIMFDSLNRKMLEPYGATDVYTPNFQRLAKKTQMFTSCFIGSMPCMPARRELHTGRLNFLHRSWGPMEPFDDSMPNILKNKGVYTHLISDHLHYWEEGGATYHTQYNSWEISRGQQGDKWIGHVGEVQYPDNVIQRRDEHFKHDAINRTHMRIEKDYPQAKTFERGLEFLKTNVEEQDWFLQIETFDPHEPFVAPDHYRELYGIDTSKKLFDWPKYGKVSETHEEAEDCRLEYKALLSMCDAYVGKVLDFMDDHNMWEDTMLIVNTDHGFMLNEHDWWGKCIMPFYEEVAHIPLFIYDPRNRYQDVQRHALVQNLDLAPTLLELFNCPIPEDMQGIPLTETLLNDKPVREAALFGQHGGQVNCTDGRYVYMRSCGEDTNNQPLYNYTLMPTHMRSMFTLEELSSLELSQGFSFTKGTKVMKIKTNSGRVNENTQHNQGNLIFDLEKDPQQQHPLEDPDLEKKMVELMVGLMKANEAPVEQYTRMNLLNDRI